jgi:Raf kinase inhibitor-like YbhB/YbcL family protein
MKVKKSIRMTVTLAATALLAGGAAAAYSAAGPFYPPAIVRSNVPFGTPMFQVSSPQLAGGVFQQAQYWNSFGCTGGNQAPTLHWSGAPATAKSFAITMFDKDAATGSGFWHMVDWDIPAADTSFDGTLPAGAVEGVNDAGDSGYMGPCPPPGDIPHHLVIKVLALDVPSLGVPGSIPPALMNYIMSTHIVGEAVLTAVAQR